MKADLSSRQTNLRSLLIMSVSVIVSVFIGELLVRSPATQDAVVMVYALCIVIVSALTNGYKYGLICSIILSFAYNFFVIEPHLGVSALTPMTLIPFLLMAALSVMICFITGKLHQEQMQARNREEEITILYQLTKDLGTCQTVQEAIETTLHNVGRNFASSCRLLLFDSKGNPEKTFTLYSNGTILTSRPTSTVRDFSEYKKKPPEGYYINSQQYEWPAGYVDGKPIAALAIPVDICEEMNTAEFHIISTMAESAGIVISKLHLIHDQEKQKQQASQERYRANLLRSISHDLRTPLAGISGTAELLVDSLDPNSESYRLAKAIKKETRWLFDLVQNILSMTRLQEGHVQIKKEIDIVEDVIDAAIESIYIRYPEREVIKVVPDEVIAAPMDTSLIKQVLTNLIDNGIKYSPAGTPIEVHLVDDADLPTVDVSVLDCGQGISDEAMDKIFKLFYTTNAKKESKLRGFGIGLPICDTVMKAHGGSIEAANRTDRKGAVFTIHIPKK